MSLMSDEAFITAWKQIEEDAIAAIGRGDKTMDVRLSPIVWLALIEEIKKERPRNLSRLINDDHLEKLNAAIDRLHEECAFMIAYGPRETVASAFLAPDDVRRTHRVPISDELRQQIRGEGRDG